MLLSVIVPIYNVEPYLDRCVQSIVEQTYKDLEIILVDDGSTDSSPKMCDIWAQKDNRIKVIHKKNGGLSSARNAGIDIAQGEVLSFIDSDDFIELDMYETMITAMQDYGKDIACCGRIVDLWGEREKREFSISGPKVYSREEAMKEVLCLRDIDVSACDKVYKKKLFDDLRYPQGKISEDAAIIFQLLDKANGIIHVGRDFYHYIFRKSSISKSSYTHAKYNAYENCVKTKVFFQASKYSALLPYVKIYNTQVCANLLESMYLDSQSINEYKQDFKSYRVMFKEGFFLAMRKREISAKLKIRLTFIWVGRIKWFIRLKKFLKK